MVDVLVSFPDDMTQSEIGEILVRAKDLRERETDNSRTIADLVGVVESLRQEMAALSLRASSIENENREMERKAKELSAAFTDLYSASGEVRQQLDEIVEGTELGQIYKEISTLKMRASKIAEGSTARNRKLKALEKKLNH